MSQLLSAGILTNTDGDSNDVATLHSDFAAAHLERCMHNVLSDVHDMDCRAMEQKLPFDALWVLTTMIVSYASADCP